MTFKFCPVGTVGVQIRGRVGSGRWGNCGLGGAGAQAAALPVTRSVCAHGRRGEEFTPLFSEGGGGTSGDTG